MSARVYELRIKAAGASASLNEGAEVSRSTYLGKTTADSRLIRATAALEGSIFGSGALLIVYRGVPRRIYMIRTMLQAKLHRVRLTHADLDYEGSCGIDAGLLEASGIRECQYVEIYNVSNGERFSTYAIQTPRGSGEISLNGAAARKAAIGDLLIIAAYSQYTEEQLKTWRLVIVQVDQNNRPKHVPKPATDRSSRTNLASRSTRDEYLESLPWDSRA
jgi:aspartate 1-decarboxylase